MRQPRDSQRSRVYRAERAAFGTTKEGTEPARDLAAMKMRAEAILQSTHVRATYPLAPREIRIDTKRSGGASAWRRKLDMSPWSRQLGQWWVLYHELAHVIVSYDRGPDAPFHGWRFCQVYLDLVRVLHGAEAAERLKVAFKAHRVRYRPPPQLSAERRAALRAQARAYGERLRAEAAVQAWMAKGSPAGQDSGAAGHQP